MAGASERAVASTTSSASDAPLKVSPESLGLSLGSRLEVSWDVVMEDETYTVWWGGTLQSSEAGMLDISYEADHGFKSETRAITLCSNCELHDTLLNEKLAWRVPGAEENEEGEDDVEVGEEEAGEAVEARDEAIGSAKRAREGVALDVGAMVKARLDSSGRSFSASIESVGAGVGVARHTHRVPWRGPSACARRGVRSPTLKDHHTLRQVNADGTYDLACDGALVEGVPAELVEAVALASGVADALERGSAETIEGTSAFFDAFTAALTSGPKFLSLSAHQQAVSPRVDGSPERSPEGSPAPARSRDAPSQRDAGRGTREGSIGSPARAPGPRPLSACNRLLSARRWLRAGRVGESACTPSVLRRGVVGAPLEPRPRRDRHRRRYPRDAPARHGQGGGRGLRSKRRCWVDRGTLCGRHRRSMRGLARQFKRALLWRCVQGPARRRPPRE